MQTNFSDLSWAYYSKCCNRKKSISFSYFILEIHINFVVRSNSIENDCKNGKAIHSFFFSISSSPPVNPFLLLNSLTCWCWMIVISWCAKNFECIWVSWSTSPCLVGLRFVGIRANPFAIVISWIVWGCCNANASLPQVTEELVIAISMLLAE